MKPFDIEKAKAGAKVVTRDGCKARILAFDLDHDQPLVVAVARDSGETICTHSSDGKFYEDGTNHGRDLMMAPVKVVKWARVNDRGNGPYVCARMFDSEQEARDAYPSALMVAVAPVEWEE